MLIGRLHLKIHSTKLNLYHYTVPIRTCQRLKDRFLIKTYRNLVLESHYQILM